MEGDWSNGAFFLAANAWGSELEILGLLDNSAQGLEQCVEKASALVRERFGL